MRAVLGDDVGLTEGIDLATLGLAAAFAFGLTASLAAAFGLVLSHCFLMCTGTVDAATRFLLPLVVR